MHRFSILIWIGIALLLTACGSQRNNAQEVVERFAAAGLAIGDMRPVEHVMDPNLPAVYREYIRFQIKTNPPGGGSVFVCGNQEDCALIYQYFADNADRAGPYLYRNSDGTVVVHLYRELEPEVAQQFAAVINTLP